VESSCASCGATVHYFIAALSPDSRLVAAIDTRGDVAHVWNAITGAPVAESGGVTIEDPGGPLSSWPTGPAPASPARPATSCRCEARRWDVRAAAVRPVSRMATAHNAQNAAYVNSERVWF
jgi:hypothetical protein